MKPLHLLNTYCVLGMRVWHNDNEMKELEWSGTPGSVGKDSAWLSCFEFFQKQALRQGFEETILIRGDPRNHR